jgi:hypothetical protein
MSSVEDFAEQLFSSAAGGAGSVSLDIDVETPSELFEVLLLIMTCGMKRWYGQRINIADVNIEHIKKLQEYFLSFGILLHVDVRAEPDIYALDNKEYIHSQLKMNSI